MKSWKTPTPEQVARAVALLGHVEQYRYFFDRLENPLWLEPLAERGFFKRPPAPVKEEARGSVGFPPWPESRYLARMAKLAEVQENALKIAVDIPDTENVRVHEDLTDLALVLPVAMAARLVPNAKKWTESPYQLLLAEKLGALVGHLARGGEVDEALDLARALLAVLPDPRAGSDTDLPEEMRFAPEPTARFDVWHYEQILKKHLGELVDAAGQRALTLFCDLLESAVQLSRRRAENGDPEDYSWIWRPAIEEHEQNRGETVRTLLVSAVRDAAERLADRAAGSVPDLVRLLEARPSRIFHRLALHLLQRFPDSSMALVEERLTDRERFDDPGLRHEYVLLAATCFGRASDGARRTLLGWIDQGPDMEAFATRFRDDRGAEPAATDIDRYGKIWRRDHLAPLREVLPVEWRTRYEDLVAEVGEAEHPEFSSYMSAGWVGPTSPKTVDELRVMTVEAIVESLKAWTPPKEWFGPSREGLGRQLASVVQGDPERFAREARLFAGADPTYVRALVTGLTDALKEHRSFDWSPVVELYDWVVRQPRELPERQRQDDEDPDWGWTRKSIAGLLAAGFERDVAGLPFELRERTWRVLRQLTDDPEPTPEYEARHGGTNMEPATLSINTTRGEAMHAVVRYALWVRRHVERLPSGQELVSSGFNAMPEVREVLEAHLEPAQDPSLAIRSVYGQWFPWLVLLDRAWAVAQAGAIFPAAPERAELRDAAWETYVVFCAPYDNVFPVLEGQYAKAIERIGSLSQDRRHLADPEEQLAEHLMVFYWRGRLTLEEPGSSLGRFYEKAPDRLRAKAVRFVGRSLRETKGEVPPEIIERLTRLWGRRIAEARATPTESVEEIANFGWWFVSGKLDETWTTQQLEEALGLAKKAEPDHLVAERLAELASRRPGQAVRCLEGLVEADREGWGILAWEGQARTILATAIRSNDTDARDAAVALIHRLGARGRLGFRDLLEQR